MCSATACGVGARRAGDEDAAASGGGEIDVVDADAVAGDDPQVGAASMTSAVTGPWRDRIATGSTAAGKGGDGVGLWEGRHVVEAAPAASSRATAGSARRGAVMITFIGWVSPAAARDGCVPSRTTALSEATREANGAGSRGPQSSLRA